MPCFDSRRLNVSELGVVTGDVLRQRRRSIEAF
jgi:hypothetical protein